MTFLVRAYHSTETNYGTVPNLGHSLEPTMSQGIRMPLLDRDPISIPLNSDERLRIACNPHILKVDITEQIPGSLAPPKARLLAEIRDSLGPVVADFEIVWGKGFFDGWALNFRTPGKTTGLYVESAGSIEILNGHSVASVFLPSSLFISKPNPSGRISSDEPVEAQLKATLDAITYLTVRFLSGLFFGLGAEDRLKSDLLAIEFLQPYFRPAKQLFFHYSTEKDVDLQDDEILQKLITDSKNRGARQVRILWGQQLGNVQFESGRDLAALVSPDKIAECTLFLVMAKTLGLVIDMRLEARSTHLGQRGIRKTIGSHSEPTFEVAREDLSVPVDQSWAVAKARSRTPTFDEIVLLAREYDVDLTDIFAEQRYLQPIVAAWRAVGRYERRRLVPDPETEAGLLALYGLRALKDLLGPAQANAGLPAAIIEHIGPAADAILPRFFH